MGSYLRTNYRISGRELDIDAIGGGLGVYQGSYASGPGTRREYGGFIMNMSGVTGVSVYKQSSVGAMSEYYGGGMFGEGYRIMPLLIDFRSFAASMPDLRAFASLSYDSGTTGSIFAIIPRMQAITWSGVSGINSIWYAVTNSTLSACDLVWAGFIVSSP